MAGTHRRRDQPGQVLVLFAMSMVVIMAAAGLAFDIGRFYSEKRFLQNAADAGALAVANALIRGESNTVAEADGRDVLTRNLIGSPTGTPGVVATTPEYESGHMGEAEYLCDRVLLLYQGRIIDEGAVPELCARAGTRSLAEAFLQRIDQAGGQNE